MATTANRSLETTFYKKLPEWKLEPTCEVKGQKPIRIGLLKAWMRRKEEDSIKTNGELLFDEIQPLEGSLDSASHILESCTLVFSWLLERNRGKLIRIFHNFDVNDAKLRDPQYILDEDEDLERGLESYTSKNPAAFKKLMMHLEISRWQFCPYLLDSDLYTKDRIVPFGNKLYMPFCRQWSVAPAEAGGTADVYLAHIQEEFVAEDIRQHLGAVVIDELYEKCYKLAIKRLSVARFNIYNQERRAFKGLRDKRGMLQCLGFYSYTDNKRPPRTHYNILLEYAEMNLHEFFQDADPPQLAEEILSQWESFCKIAKAIETLHDFNYKGANWSGWHGDIKPRNLLLVGEEWKLADYGFAIFQEGSTRDRPTAQFKACSETWGAPETVSRGNDILQTVDTWSFGCVLSIMATWIVRGWRGVCAYEQYRLQASENAPPSDAFHNGRDVLRQIRAWHEHLKRISRRCDDITHRILDIVDNHLLLKDAQARFSSTQLRERLDHELVASRRSSIDAPQRDEAQLGGIESVRFGSDGNGVFTFEPRPHVEYDDTDLTRSVTTAMGPDFEHTDVPTLEPLIVRTSMETPNGLRGPSLLPFGHSEGDMSVDPRPGPPSHEDISPLTTDTSRGSFSSAPAPTIDSVTLVDSNRDEAVMENVWELAKALDSGDRALKAYFLNGQSWIARRVDRDGRTPIMIAAMSNNLNVVKLLYAYSDLSRSDKSQKTTLHHLIVAQQDEKETPQFMDALRCILGSDSPPGSILSFTNRPDENGRTPVMLVAGKGYLEAVKLLTQHSDLSRHDRDRKTVLHHLVGSQHGKVETHRFLETLKDILVHDMSPEARSRWINQPDSDQHTCLFLCVWIGSLPQTLSELLRGGAFIDVADIRAENTPLAVAARKGSERTVTMMLEHVPGNGVSAELRRYLNENRRQIHSSVWRLLTEAKICDAKSRRWGLRPHKKEGT